MQLVETIESKIHQEAFKKEYSQDYRFSFYFFVIVMNLGAFIWTILTLLFGFYLSASFAGGFILMTLINFGYFMYSYNFPKTRFVQVLGSMLLPFIFQWSLGGYIATGAVMIWSFLTLIGVLTFFRATKKAVHWLLFFFVLLIASFFIDNFVHVNTSKLLDNLTIQHVLFTVNIGIVGLSIFFITHYFISNSRKERASNIALEKKRSELQQKNEEVMEMNEKLHQQQEQTKAINEELEIQKNEVQKKNEAITASLNYAQNIQNAILGNPEVVTSTFKSGFVYFRPRDIVSGDFYWFSVVKKKVIARGTQTSEDRKTVFLKVVVAGDCTGHGVPGAFMTFMGNSFLDEIINENKMTKPSRILTILDSKLTSILQNRKGQKKINDGMDLSVAIIDEQNKKIQFSGANNPLYYIPKSTRTADKYEPDSKLQVYKGSKFAIGGKVVAKKRKAFDNNVIKYEEGDVFYLFSDGYQDQFGGDNDRKFLKKRYRHLLERISHLPLNDQEQILDQEFLNWKGDHKQTDDVLVIGIEL